MALKIGVVNQKGGVGKTTTAICLTDAFTQMGYKTLLIDFDPQGNSSKVFQAKDNELNIYDGIFNKVPLKDIVVKGNDMGDIIPANSRLKSAYDLLPTVKAAEKRLMKAIAGIEEDYEVIIIDSGPTAGKIMDNVLTAVNGIVIPMEAAQFSIDGLGDILNTVDEVKEDLNPELKVYGVLLTKYKGGSTQKDAKESFDNLPDTFVHTFKTIIRDSDAIPSTQSFLNYKDSDKLHEKKKYESQGSIYKYDTGNNAAVDYSSFAKELLEVIDNG